MSTTQLHSGSPNIFHRPGLAARIAGQVLHVSPTSASSSGVFLAAPRRTGKTTFMREDLAPALSEKGALVCSGQVIPDTSIGCCTAVFRS